MSSSNPFDSEWKPPIKLIQNTWMPAYMFKYEDFGAALNYKAAPGDIFIATYPKNGTTWMQYICWGIKNKGATPMHVNEVMSEGIPFIEMTGPGVLENLPPPKIIKTHFSYTDVPKNPEAKYIHVARNPKDTVVSFYHHHKMMGDAFDFNGFDFDEYFECFMRGDLPWGDYFDHVLGWWAHKDDPNVLCLTYEEMKADHRGSVLKVAKFIGDEYYQMLIDNQEMLDNVVRNSDFKHLRSIGIGEMEIGGEKKREPTKMHFLRKGVVGDWKNHLSDDQNRRLQQRTAEKFKDVELPELWKKIMSQ